MAAYCYAVVTNIPSDTHTADLRAHFSSMVEEKCFVCFHFRHRPEKTSENQSSSSKDIKRCCIVKVLETKLQQFLAYNNQHWTGVNGQYSTDICHVSQIKLKQSDESEGDLEEIEEEKLLQMPELRPPELMPNGNVGTPTTVFLDFIQRCLLPHNLIRKLHLEFPKTRAKRIYGNVNFDYGTDFDSDEESNTFTSSRISATSSKPNNRQRVRNLKTSVMSSNNLAGNNTSIISKEREETAAERSDMTSEKSPDHDSPITSANEIAPFYVSISNENSEMSLSTEDLDRANAKNSEVSPSTLTKLATEETNKKTTGENHVSHHNKNSDKGFTKPDGHTFQAPEPVGRAGKESVKLSNRERRKQAKEERLQTRKLMDEGIEERLIATEKRYHNDEDAEEWDRHEASEDDPSNQERNKERLYEEEIEQPWEKGGPGVVFYTDAMYWQEKEGDFDEQTTDDLDVDFSAYEEAGAGDKDIKDFLKIRQEQRFRSGQDNTDMFSIGIGKRLNKDKSHSNSSTDSAGASRSSGRIGKFERFTKGIGRKVMEKQGWKEGQSLGSRNAGITEALKGEGQKASNKRGLGFVEEPPVVFTLPKRKRDAVPVQHITTIYDNPYSTDPQEPLLQRNEPTTLKHRQSHLEKFS